MTTGIQEIRCVGNTIVHIYGTKKQAFDDYFKQFEEVVKEIEHLI